MINSIVRGIIQRWIQNKRGDWNKKEPPPPTIIEEHELYMIATKIVDEINTMLANKFCRVRMARERRAVMAKPYGGRGRGGRGRCGAGRKYDGRGPRRRRRRR